MRLDIRRVGAIKKGDEIVGNETRVKVVKNKLARPFTMVNFEIRYGEGICKMSELIDLGVEHGLVEKSGAWYAHKGSKIGQGKDNARAYLEENPQIAEELNQALRDILFPDKKTGQDIKSDGKEEPADKIKH